MTCKLNPFGVEMTVDPSQACELDEYITEVKAFEVSLRCFKLNSLTIETQRLFLTALNAIQWANKAITQETAYHDQTQNADQD